MEVVGAVVGVECPTPRKSEFTFDLSMQAAKKNYMVLGKYDFDLKRALEAQAGTPLAYGSEFCHPDHLERLLGKHPLWGHMREILQHGSIWPLDAATEEERLLDLQAALKFGNHKGANKQTDLLKKLCNADVTHGFAMALPLDKIHLLPGAHIAPMNIIQEHHRRIWTDSGQRLPYP